MEVPVDVTILRSGVPEILPGRSLNVCERGMAAMLAGEVIPGESVGIAVRLSQPFDVLQARAVIRHQDKLRCGMEFMGLSPEQRAKIRDWTRETKAEAEGSAAPVSPKGKLPFSKPPALQPDATRKTTKTDKPLGNFSKTSQRLGWTVSFAIMALVAALFWWRWNRGWDELESGLKTSEETASFEKPQAQVPAEVMQRLLVHRVEPVYPPQARQEGLEGTIAIDIIVGRDGSIIHMQALNGPDVLARAAADALRWWKFQPYRLNGEPAVVETRVAVEFKL